MLTQDPVALAAWFDAGLGLDWVQGLAFAGPAVATAWRAAGFDAATAAALVGLHPALTPARAHAFEVAGIDPPERVAWVAAGVEARARRRYGPTTA